MASAPSVAVSEVRWDDLSGKGLAFQPLFEVKEPRRRLRRNGRATEKASFVTEAMAAGLQMVASAPAAMETIAKRRKWQVRLTMLVYSASFAAGIGFLGVAAYEQVAGGSDTTRTGTIAGISAALLLGLLIVRPTKGIERASLNDTAMLLLTTNYSARVAYAFMEENPGRADIRLEDIERDAFEQVQSTLRMYERLETPSNELLAAGMKSSRDGAAKKKASTKKKAVKKAKGKTSPTKKSTAKKTPTRKGTGKKTPTKQSTTKKTPTKKGTGKKTPTKTTSTGDSRR